MLSRRPAYDEAYDIGIRTVKALCDNIKFAVRSEMTDYLPGQGMIRYCEPCCIRNDSKPYHNGYDGMYCFCSPIHWSLPHKNQCRYYYITNPTNWQAEQFRNIPCPKRKIPPGDDTIFFRRAQADYTFCQSKHVSWVAREILPCRGRGQSSCKENSQNGIDIHLIIWYNYINLPQEANTYENDVHRRDP